MNNQRTRNAGWAAYSSGITALLSFAAYLAFLVFDLPHTLQSGNINHQRLTGDLITLFQGLSFLSMIPIALALHELEEKRTVKASRIALGVGIFGMVLMTTFSIFVLLRLMSEPQVGTPTALAFGAVGLWLIAANYFTRDSILPTRLVWLGIFIGAAYVLYALFFWISGAANVESSSALQSNVPFLIGYVALNLSSFILYPIWAIWLGRLLQTSLRINAFAGTLHQSI